MEIKLLNYRYFNWLIFIAWAGFIFLLSSIPSLVIESIGILDFIFRKAAHFLEFVILSILFGRALSFSCKISIKKILIYSFIFGFVYAVSDEVHQYFVEGRECNIIDMLIDSLGVFTGCMVFFKLKNKILK